MNDQTSKKMLAFMTFASSTVSAFCLGMMAFTYTTGDLPLGIEPLMAFDETPVEIEAPVAEEPDSEPSLDVEKHAVHLFQQLEDARQELSSDRQELVERERYVEMLAENVRVMQEKLDESEVRIRNLLEIVDKKEVENVQQLTKVIAGMELQAGADMLMALEDPLPSRILYFMKAEKKTAMLTTMMRIEDEELKERAVKIAERMQRISEELSL